jgi:hypothetical protein
MRIARAAFVVLAASLASCVSARDCATSIPADLRADAIRYVLDQHLCKELLLPQPDRLLAMSAGTPYAELTQARRRALDVYAAGYAACVKELVDRN